jgi:large subunit ribosomal protein L9
MEVILIDDVFELGRRGQIVRVADGYGRNYLIPKQLAIPATPGNRKIIEQQRLSIAKKEAKYTEEAELLAQELGQTHVLISRKSGDAGTLFGSVTSKDIVNLLKTSKIQIDRRKIMLQQPIKSIGNYQIGIRLHSDVTAELLVSILLEGDQPVARIKKKDEESDQIVSELDARVQEISRLARTETVEEATSEEAPAEEATEAAEEATSEEAPAEEATEAAEEATSEEAPAEETTEAVEEGESLTEEAVVEKKTEESTTD